MSLGKSTRVPMDKRMLRKPVFAEEVSTVQNQLHVTGKIYICMRILMN